MILKASSSKWNTSIVFIYDLKGRNEAETKNIWQFSQNNALNFQFQIFSNFSVQNDSRGPQ